MAIKKETILISVVFDEDETHSNSAAEAIDHRLFNEDGIIEWDYVVKDVETLSAKNNDEE